MNHLETKLDTWKTNIDFLKPDIEYLRETIIDFSKPDLDFWEEWNKGLNVATLIFFADFFMIVVWLWLIPTK